VCSPRSSTGTQGEEGSAKMPTTGVKAGGSSETPRARRRATAKISYRQPRSPNINDHRSALETARRSKKSPLHAKAFARTMSAAAIARHKRAGRVEERDG